MDIWASFEGYLYLPLEHTALLLEMIAGLNAHVIALRAPTTPTAAEEMAETMAFWHAGCRWLCIVLIFLSCTGELKTKIRNT